MYENLEKKVNAIKEELEDCEYVSQELVDRYYELEKELEIEVEISFENEKEKYKNLFKKLKSIKSENDIM